MLTLPPTPNSITIEPNDEIAYFANKYGFHGTIMALGDRSRALLEVKQLDFSTIYHRWPTKRWDNPNPLKWWDYAGCDPDEVARHAIPQLEQLRFGRSLFYATDILRAYDAGAKYNLPIGKKDWVEATDPEYTELTKLKVLDYV